MAVRITSRHFDIGEQTRDYIENKVAKLTRFDERESDIDVILTQEKYRYIVEINIKFGKFEAAAKEEEQDLVVAFDACLKQVERQIKKQKEKYVDTKKQAKKKLRSLVMNPESIKRDAILRKEIDLPSLYESEAIVRFNDEKPDFLLYKDPKKQTVNLLIRSVNGSVALYEIK